MLAFALSSETASPSEEQRRGIWEFILWITLVAFQKDFESEGLILEKYKRLDLFRRLATLFL